MAGNSVIGALRVDLGLNSTQFQAGLKQAQSGLASFGRMAVAGLQLVSVAALAAGAALGVAVKGAIDHADALSKSAQKAGVTVEALSRLEYAAKLSDVSLEGLTGGLSKLSKAMADATITKTSTAAIAFKALGISITDASGRLRSSTAVLGEIADRFAKLPDSATKTALALQIFGKSGAELIPLLNGGSKGLADMAAEADRLGVTINSKTARAAEEFNDTLTRIGEIMQGVVNQVMEAALPALQDLANVLASPEFANSAKTFATNTIEGLSKIVEWIANVKVNWNDLVQTIHHGVLKDIINKPQVSSNIEDRTAPVTGIDRLNGAAGQLLLNSTFDQVGSKTFGSVDALKKYLTPPTVDVPKLTGATKALKDWNDELDGAIKRNQEVAASIRDSLTGAIQGFVQAIRQGTDPLQAFGDQLANIGQQLLNAGIQSVLSNIFTPNFIGGTLGAPALKLGFQTGIPGFASGTMSAPPGMAWVGEHGPELVNFRGGEQVIPNDALGGQSTVRIALDPGLVASILDQSKQQSIQIVRTGAPAAVAAARRNRTGG